MRDHESEQPYEKALNDATEGAAFIFNGLLFWAGWLGSFFLLATIGVAIFGGLYDVVWWVLLFITFWVGIWAGKDA